MVGNICIVNTCCTILSCHLNAEISGPEFMKNLLVAALLLLLLSALSQREGRKNGDEV